MCVVVCVCVCVCVCLDRRCVTTVKDLVTNLYKRIVVAQIKMEDEFKEWSRSGPSSHRHDAVAMAM